MKKMLINATKNDEWRVAVVDGRSLYDLDIEFPGQEQTIANIYKGRVSRVEPSLEAAFIDYGGNRHGFLSIKDLSQEYYPNRIKNSRLSIKDILREGQEIIVQVEKEERGTKGAALTTCISLAGCYMVLMPTNADAGGISRRIEGSERQELREVFDDLDIPENMGVIIRTAGVGKTIDELQWDLDALVNVWNAIKEASKTNNPLPFLIHQEGNVIIRAMRDYLRPDISEIVVDDDKAFGQLKKYLRGVRPEYADKIKLYEEKEPLFSHYNIESQTETIFKHEVRLPSGGEIVIDHAEALIAIDVNSSRATRGNDIEETALSTNLEAAEEIARQLRLRDLGGLIIIDFIDMIFMNNKRNVEQKLRDTLRSDRARVQIGNISRFGLLEMSRQRLRSALRESRYLTCPRCHGQGVVRSVVALTSSLLHLLEEKAAEESTAQLLVQVPPEVATYLFNEKRQMVVHIENHYNISIVIVANSQFETPHYDIKAITVHEYATKALVAPSYQLADRVKVDTGKSINLHETVTKHEKPAVDLGLPGNSRKTRTRRSNHKLSLLQRLIKNLFGSKEKKNNRKGNKKVVRSSSRATGKRGKNFSKTSTKNTRGSRSGNYRSGQQATKSRSSSSRRSTRSNTKSRTMSTNKNYSGGNRSRRNEKSTNKTKSVEKPTQALLISSSDTMPKAQEKIEQPNRNIKPSPVAEVVQQSTEKPKRKSALPPPPITSSLLDRDKLQQVETVSKSSEDQSQAFDGKKSSED